MSMIKCPECGKDVSDKAEVCLNCGYNIAKYFEIIEKENQERIKRESEERREKEEFERRMENVKLPPKHRISWYISCVCFGTIFLLALFASLVSKNPPKSYETVICLMISILFLLILPIFIFKSENKRYEKILSDVEGYKRGQVQYQMWKENSKTVAQPNVLKCGVCGSQNISVSLQTTNVTSKGESEIRKKNVITRTGNKAGRAGMIMATGGLWALTPKKSDYKEISKESKEVQQVKMAICQNCGHSWKI